MDSHMLRRKNQPRRLRQLHRNNQRTSHLSRNLVSSIIQTPFYIPQRQAHTQRLAFFFSPTHIAIKPQSVSTPKNLESKASRKTKTSTPNRSPDRKSKKAQRSRISGISRLSQLSASLNSHSSFLTPHSLFSPNLQHTINIS